MVPLAVLFGCAVASWRLSGQADLWLDLVKIAAMIGVATLIAGFFFWSVLHRRHASWWRGGLSGGLTGALIVPLPFFAWTLKTGLLALLSSGDLASIPSILAKAVEAGLWTFEEMTRASLAAIGGSALLGGTVSQFYSK